MFNVTYQNIEREVRYAVGQGRYILDDLKKIEDKTKIVFVHGKNDKLTNYLGAKYANQKVKSKIFLTDSGHAPFLEDASQFTKIMNQ